MEIKIQNKEKNMTTHKVKIDKTWQIRFAEQRFFVRLKLQATRNNTNLNLRSAQTVEYLLYFL